MIRIASIDDSARFNIFAVDSVVPGPDEIAAEIYASGIACTAVAVNSVVRGNAPTRTIDVNDCHAFPSNDEVQAIGVGFTNPHNSTKEEEVGERGFSTFNSKNYKLSIFYFF